MSSYLVYDDIVAAAEAAGVSYSELAEAEVDAALTSISDRFADPGGEGLLIHRLKDVTIRFDEEGWRSLGELKVEQPLMLVDGPPERMGFRFPNGMNDVADVIGDCPSFEFFLTDDEVSFVLALNHHDAFLGVGIGAEFIRGLL